MTNEASIDRGRLEGCESARSTPGLGLEQAPPRRVRRPEPVEMTAYHIVAESLANTARHAHASHAHLQATVRNGRQLWSVSLRRPGGGGVGFGKVDRDVGLQ